MKPMRTPLLLPILLAAAAAALAPAQTLVVVRPDAERDIPIPGGSLDVGSAAPGDFLDTRLRIRNTGTAPAVLSVLTIAGAGFSLQGDPPRPLTLAPGVNADFRVRFRPPASGSYSATLRVNSDAALLLRGSAAAGLALLLERDRTLVANDRAIEFAGAVTVGQRGRLGLLLRNDGAGPAAVRQLAIAGTAFALSPDLPVQVPPGEEARFEIWCEPVRAGFLSGTLQLDGRTFTVAALAREPEVPSALLEVDPDAARSGKQGRLRIRLAAPALAAVTGTLRLEFTPSVDAGAGDPAIQFPANSSREVPVAVSAGASEVVQDGKAEIVFQTGSTAGTLVFRLKLGSQDREFPIVIPPEAPRIDAVEMKTSAGSVEVTVTGFDNHRSAGNIVFAFTDRAGQEVPAVSAEAGPLFTRYFRESAMGGLFRLRASFPVSGGDASRLAGVTVKLANGIGASSGKTP